MKNGCKEEKNGENNAFVTVYFIAELLARMLAQIYSVNLHFILNSRYMARFGSVATQAA